MSTDEPSSASLQSGTIGARLKAERIRLGLSQEALGSIGGVRKQAQLLYEKNSRCPDGHYLSSVFHAGVDVQFVLAGVRQGSGISAPVVHQAVLDAVDLLSLDAVDASQLAKAVTKLATQSTAHTSESANAGAAPNESDT